jgi:hypothetical protein
MRRDLLYVRTLCALLTAGMLACGEPERAELEVELVPPIAFRFVVHGNCFAGWYMVVDLVVHETRGVEVVLDAVSLHADDGRTGELLGERMLDATVLQAPERFGESGPVVRAHGSLRIPMSVGALKGAVDAPAISGSIVVSGDVEGHDVRKRRDCLAQPRLAAKRVIEKGARSTGGARPRTRPATISPTSGPIRMPLR